MRGAHVIGAERHEEAATEVVAEHDGANQLGARAALAFCHRERRWNDGRSRMRLGHRLEVVGLVRVREHPVRERGVHRCRANVCREDRRLGRSALRANVARGHDAGRQHGAGDHRADGVEDAVLGVAHDRRGQVSIPRRDHVTREPAGHVAGGTRLDRARWRFRV